MTGVDDYHDVVSFLVVGVSQMEGGQSRLKVDDLVEVLIHDVHDGVLDGALDDVLDEVLDEVGDQIGFGVFLVDQSLQEEGSVGFGVVLGIDYLDDDGNYYAVVGAKCLVSDHRGEVGCPAVLETVSEVRYGG